MKKSVVLAAIILSALLAYFGVRAMMRQNEEANTPTPTSQSVRDQQAEAGDTLPKVVATELIAENHEVYLSLKGRTAPNRVVTVKSATTGSVVEAPALEGRTVGKDALLCRLDVEVRNARLAEARALVEARQIDYNAAAELATKGWASPNRASSAKASLDAAMAALNSAQVELGRTEIRAPFSGVFETRLAETGDFLSPGGACGVIADLNPIRIEANVTEEYATALKPRSPVTIKVLNASPRTGTISYIARTADDATRTFRIEATLDNADGAISAGLTSDLRIQIGETLATAISPGLLSLHDDGRVGVRHVTEEGVIAFSPVTIVDDTAEGIWVTGLPERAYVVSVGQEYISEGARVETVSEAELTQ